MTMKRKTFTTNTENGMVQISAHMGSNDFQMLEKAKEYVPNKELDALEELCNKVHEIEVPNELRELLHEHVCMGGRLILSSFLSKDLQERYHAYITAKGMHNIIDNGVQQISSSINAKIMERLKKQGW